MIDACAVTLLRAWLAVPGDPLCRLALADRLEELGDPRADLLRLAPSLLAVPEREGLRPDLPCEARWGLPVGVVLGRARARTSLGEWPGMVPPRPPWKAAGTGPRNAWVGVRRLGRLLCIALASEGERLGVFRNQVTEEAVEHVLCRCEAYQCGLVGPASRDGGRYGFPGRQSMTPWGRAEYHCARGRGGFAGYVAVALEMAAHAPFSWSAVPVERVEILRARARVWGRLLDLHDEFCRLAPWEAARAAGRLEVLLP